MHIYIYIYISGKFQNETSLAIVCKTSAKYNYSHSDNKIMSVLPPIECYCLHSLCYSRMAFFHMKHETKLKR